ncbi:MAG: hypothetical protein PHV93_02850 [Candidatus Pacebacteria bacterium]|nr:hypothetical protein [Candidatus Paceibacterota bacterium]
MRKQIAEDRSPPASSLLQIGAGDDALDVLSLSGGISGDLFQDFVRAGMFPHVMKHFAARLVENSAFEDIRGSLDCLCAVSVESIKFATHISALCDCRDIYLEHEERDVDTNIQREASMLVVGRHKIERGIRYGLVDNVLNFSTVDEAARLIMSKGGIVVGLFGILNCSPRFITSYVSQGGAINLPVIAVKHEPNPIEVPWQSKDRNVRRM